VSVRPALPLLGALLAPSLGADPEPDPASADDAAVGPVPSHEILRPIGLHREGKAVVPAAPTPCVAKAQVYVPWSVCRDIGAPRRGEEPLQIQGFPQGVPALPEGTRCAFTCLPDARLASWSFVVPQAGWQGEIACRISANFALTLRLGPTDTAPSAGATVQWQTDLDVTTYLVDDPRLLQASAAQTGLLVFDATRTMDPSVACPAGQPARP